MKLFDGILICTDLDGTLLDSKKQISDENKEAIEYFKSRGGKFTFITGRMPFYATDTYKAINPNAPFGCGNGCGVYDHVTKEYLWNMPMRDDALELTEYADNSIENLGVMVNTFDNVYFCSNNQATESFRRLTGMPNLTRGYDEINEPVAKIVFADTDSKKIDRLERLLMSHPKASSFDFIRSERTLFEILTKGLNKGSVMLKIAELTGIKKSKTVAIGDYDNDISMIRAAGVGVAVANASQGAKDAADYTTVSNNENAIAKLIYDIESGKIEI